MSDLSLQQFKGVSKRSSCNKYQAQYCFKRKLFWAGNHDTPEEAARAYDLKAVEIYGEKVITNFAVEGVNTNVLFPDYPATKRHEVSNSATRPVESVREPIQLTIATDDNVSKFSHEETVFDRMRAFAVENGIELKTMKIA